MSLEMFQKAKLYLKFGWSVIPVSAEKTPLVNWKIYQERLPTEDEINDWFGECVKITKMTPNIGIVTGKISGITVVDVEEGGNISDYPKTTTAKTGGGGRHFFFKYQPGIKNLVRIRELTDIRNDGGYVIVPPSISTKGSYEWIDKTPPTDFPISMFELPSHQIRAARSQCDELPKYDGISTGGRNDAMTRYTGSILPLIHPLDWETVAWEKIVEENKKNTPPLDEQELRAIFTSILNREKQNPSVRKPREIIETGNDDDNRIVLMSELAKTQKIEDLDTFSTGFQRFDDSLLGGFKEGDLVVATAQTGHGKTSFAQTLTKNMARQGVPSLFFSYEVLVSNIWRKFVEMGLNDDDIVFAPMRNVSGTIDWIEQRILDGVKNHMIKFVVIDHLGFLFPRKTAYDSQLNSNYSAFLGSVCRDLKTLAIKNNLVILLLVHTKKTDKPTINDIRDSSGIAQEADSVFILERQVAGGRRGQDEETLYTNDTIITLVKNRMTGLTPRVLCHMVNSQFIEKFNIDMV